MIHRRVDTRIKCCFCNAAAMYIAPIRNPRNWSYLCQEHFHQTADVNVIKLVYIEPEERLKNDN